jgi:hypothetical protein
MKTELRLAPHSVLPGQNVIEIVWNGRLVGTVTGSDTTPGVRVISKYNKKVHVMNSGLEGEHPELILEVRLPEVN